MPPLSPPLLSGEIHVWHLTADAETITTVAALLDDDERARAARFAFARDRDLYMATRGWLRLLAGEYLAERPESLRFTAGAYGKPQLANDAAPLQFNVSHSGHRALLAFAVDRAVGVDIECIDERPETLAVAASVFTPPERHRLEQCPPGERLATFYRLWTGKEAVLKAAGRGVSIPFQSFSVSPTNDLAISDVIVLRSSMPPLFVQWLDAPIGYVAALAAAGPPWQLRVFHPGDLK